LRRISLIYWSGWANRILGNALTLGILVEFTRCLHSGSSDRFRICARNSYFAVGDGGFGNGFSNWLDEPITIESARRCQAPGARRAARLNSATCLFSYRKPWSNPRKRIGACGTCRSGMQSGQTFAIVGPTGAGKTTLISLLLRFYDYSAWDRFCWTAWTSGHAGSAGISGTIRNRAAGSVICFPARLNRIFDWAGGNYAEGCRESAGRDRAGRIFIVRCRRAWKRKGNERGSTLSVGSAATDQFCTARLGTIRGFSILDEATSSVDTKKELLIREALDRFVERWRTAHGDCAPVEQRFQHADRIWCFTKGVCGKRAHTRNCWRSAGFITGFVPVVQYKGTGLAWTPMAFTGGGVCCRPLRRRVIEHSLDMTREKTPRSRVGARYICLSIPKRAGRARPLQNQAKDAPDTISDFGLEKLPAICMPRVWLRR